MCVDLKGDSDNNEIGDRVSSTTDILVTVVEIFDAEADRMVRGNL